jgi:osmotically-inducible protein OsmY
MAEPAALLILPPGEQTPDVEAVPLESPSLEDRRLAERVERALRASGYGPLRALGVAVQARLVILSGPVPSYYLKQVAQAIALTVPGAHAVRNALHVARPS